MGQKMNREDESRFDLFLSLVPVLIVLGIIFLDRITKIYFSHFLSVGESLPIIRNFLHMTLVHNTGIAFGWFRDQGIVFIIIPIIAIFLLIYNITYYQRNREKISWTYCLAFSLILGGAIGNLIDRVYYGYVIDFIDFQIWPVFNIADSAITIGAVMIAMKCIPERKNA